MKRQIICALFATAGVAVILPATTLYADGGYAGGDTETSQGGNAGDIPCQVEEQILRGIEKATENSNPWLKRQVQVHRETHDEQCPNHRAPAAAK